MNLSNTLLVLTYDESYSHRPNTVMNSIWCSTIATNITILKRHFYDNNDNNSLFCTNIIALFNIVLLFLVQCNGYHLTNTKMFQPLIKQFYTTNCKIVRMWLYISIVADRNSFKRETVTAREESKRERERDGRKNNETKQGWDGTERRTIWQAFFCFLNALWYLLSL